MSSEAKFETAETIYQRNQRIKAELAAGMLPVLPFEKEVIEKQLQKVIEDQDALGRELSIVNHQGSETWHDNAAANQAEWDSMVVKNRGNLIAEATKRAVDIGYPPAGDEVTIGSFIDLRFTTDGASSSALLTGKVRESDESFKDFVPEGITFITVESPIGAALLSARPGEFVSYEVGGRPRQAQVLSVSQLQTG